MRRLAAEMDAVGATWPVRQRFKARVDGGGGIPIEFTENPTE